MQPIRLVRQQPNYNTYIHDPVMTSGYLPPVPRRDVIDDVTSHVTRPMTSRVVVGSGHRSRLRSIKPNHVTLQWPGGRCAPCPGRTDSTAQQTEQTSRPLPTPRNHCEWGQCRRHAYAPPVRKKTTTFFT